LLAPIELKMLISLNASLHVLFTLKKVATMKYYSLLASILLSSGSSAYAQNNSLDGFWRGVFTLPNATEAPFNFELKGQTA